MPLAITYSPDSPLSMRPPNFDILPKSAVAKVLSSTPYSKFLQRPRLWLTRLTRYRSIHQKIGYGYILSMSVAVLGTAVGLAVGDYFENKALEEFTIAQERHNLMEDLQQSVLEITAYQQKLFLVAEYNSSQKYKIKDVLEHLTKAETSLSQLQANLKDERGFTQNYAAQLKPVLQTLDTDINSYIQSIHLLLNYINTDIPKADDIQAANDILENTVKGNLIPKIERLAVSLEQLVDLHLDQRRYVLKAFQAAKLSRAIIILLSMLLSMALATALAFYTSRAIARPIQAVTDIAKQVTQDGNFDLQVPVTSADEIGVLATSLNHLIEQVATQIHDLKQAQAQLIQSEKMASLGQMVAGIAHEINNPVNFIYGNLVYAEEYSNNLIELIQLYQHYYPNPPQDVSQKIEEIELSFLCEDLQKLLFSMSIGADRIQQIIRSLRNFSRLDEAEVKQVDIHEGIDNTLLILSYRSNQGIEFIKQYGSLPLIECCPAQLNQVFMNIINNAIDELLNHKNLPKKQIVIRTRVTDEGRIQVRIGDNGPGIPPDIKAKIFDPFFTTKPVGKGTGMGLAICYQIIEKHYGTIEVFSEIGEGAEFVVTLPVEQKLAAIS